MLALCRLGCVGWGATHQQGLPAAATALLRSVTSSTAPLLSPPPPATGAQLHAASTSSRSFCSTSSNSSSQQAGATPQTQPAADASSSSSSSKADRQQQQQQQYRPLPPGELAQLRAAIFEQHVGDGRRSGRKVLLRPLKGRHIADWYFTLTQPQPGLQPDDLEEERVFKTQLARATGGGPPKKGQGKRSKK